MIEPAERLTRLQPYFFADLHRRVAEMTAAGQDVIRMDVGSPDLPPANPIIQALQGCAGPQGQHSYSSLGANRRFRQAAAGYYRRRFGVELDPETDVLGLLGSKEGIFNIHLAMVNPGDVVLVPDPGYPIYQAAARLAGAEVVSVPLLADNGFLPDLSAIPAGILARTTILWLNYP
ncbi:MAG: aminotransferase class I/II-fold pyridoxal phosphate-dependent enzyme, partial [Chloroflexi bacterium]|nr:aminotransferase class I/II-fold pyridoxal phosphate-dependent enzyme [Chloroflexota bacterium]